MAACRAAMLLAAAAIATCGGQTAPNGDSAVQLATAGDRTAPTKHSVTESVRTVTGLSQMGPASDTTVSTDPYTERKWLKLRSMMGNALLERMTRSGRTEGKSESIVIVVTEMCYYAVNGTYLEGRIREASENVRLLTYEGVDAEIDSEEDSVCDSQDLQIQIAKPNSILKTCEDYQKVLEILTSGPKMLIGSLKPDLCSSAIFLSKFFNTTMFSWNCPTEGGAEAENGSRTRLSPSVGDIAGAFASVVAEMKWKSVAIISLELGWHPWLSHQLEVELRDVGVIPKHFFGFKPENIAADVKKLGILKNVPCRAVILCAPADSAGFSLLKSLISLNLHFQNTLLVLIDSLNLPSWQHYFLQSNNLTSVLGDLLIFGDLRTSNDTLDNYILKNVKKGLSMARSDSFEFALSDVISRNLRNLLSARKNNSWWQVEPSGGNFAKWKEEHLQIEDCDDFCRFSADKLVGVWVYWVIVSVLLLVFAIMAMVVASKCQVLKKRSAKAPYKVLLAPTDFVFPQLADNLRVDEGIEAMLCCWLQQLQEFGGPEVDKPDLLQGSGTASARTPLRAGSSPNLAKQLVVDPRVRYNGDLVQMKPLPAGAPGELRAKTIELLGVLHGLRHENLNPLMGCLAEPSRTFLVSEYCARGSLQDVLQQDDIKLDWSFRLSLLTDLVRGMKYLHSTQIRVHGYLSSRNCVIDARWVLKVTDYGLPAFYETQGIQAPSKSSKELLWTAPELLRHSSLRKKGTQPGDVYSFGIILQEVVVRGEPFCMLALTPEEIIEKVKHPPPLIRPSVSKGAAPPEAINIMRQCWAEQAEMRPDFSAVHDQFKKLNHGRKVNIVDTMFQMLEKYSNNLEELIRERTEQLDIEKKKTEQLLNRMLPSYVADKLKLGMPVDPEEYEEVTIYFSDIVGFTTISAHSTPFQVVDLLNDLYTCFDATINAYDVYKVETIGDAYMVVGGLPVRIPDHADQVATMALDLLHQSGKFRIRHLPGTPLRLRIGLHTGPCCAGVVGLTMPRYCLFGDTVNTASRMESSGAAWRIHLSEDTKNRLAQAGGYRLEFRGPTVIKGKGTMDTYWLLGKEGFNKELPVAPSIELDESLIVCKQSMPATLQEQDSAGDSISVDSTKHHYSENHPRSPNPGLTNPSFIKSMEQSKFSTLVKAHGQEESGVSTGRRPSITEYHMVKSTSSDVPIGISLGTPVSASEVAAALLGASTSSLCGFRQRHRKIEEEDLSTPYNHYRCLSPKQKIGKLLRRQFSLDRAEENHRTEDKLSPRLQKQNSAGAADLEKIEEIPLRLPSTSPSTTVSPIQCTFSISVDSLIH